MPLWDNPPHLVTSYTVDVSRTGGGTTLSYTSAQSSIPCSINTASASEVALYAQQNIVVTHTVAFLSAALTTSVTRGMKLVAGDTSLAFYVKGIRSGRAYGGVPAMTYCDCEQVL